MAIRYFALAALLLVGASAQQFATHETIRELPKACQQYVSGETTGEWSSPSSGVTGGVCKLLPPVYDSKDQGYDFCLKCKAGEKFGVTAEELAQSIRQQVERKLKQSSQFTRKSKLDIVIDGVKKPVDLTRVLARTPDVLEQVDDVFFFFPNGQIGRIEFEHGQANELARITCRAPCRGGPKTTPSSASRYSNPRNNEVEEDDEDEQEVYGSGSSSSRYLSQQELNKKNKNKSYSPYSYGDSAYGSSSSSQWRNAASQRRSQQPSEEDEEYYGQQTSASRNAYRTNAGRYGSSSSARLNKARVVAEEDEDDK
nr:AHS beta [Pseudechiniscus sp.]